MNQSTSGLAPYRAKPLVDWFKKEYRLDFWSKAIENLNLQGKCFVSVFRDSRAYRDLTILAIAKAIQAKASGAYQATILVDALGRAERRRLLIIIALEADNWKSWSPPISRLA